MLQIRKYKRGKPMGQDLCSVLMGFQGLEVVRDYHVVSVGVP